MSTICIVPRSDPSLSGSWPLRQKLSLRYVAAVVEQPTRAFGSVAPDSFRTNEIEGSVFRKPFLHTVIFSVHTPFPLFPHFPLFHPGLDCATYNVDYLYW
jgi:hypothetical protein